MEHVVFFPGADGAEAFSRTADLDEAVRIVERLRNDNGVGNVSVFALHPVPLAFRTYVHVELPPVDESSAPADPEHEEFAQTEPSEPVEPVHPVESVEYEAEVAQPKAEPFEGVDAEAPATEALADEALAAEAPEVEALDVEAHAEVGGLEQVEAGQVEAGQVEAPEAAVDAEVGEQQYVEAGQSEPGPGVEDVALEVEAPSFDEEHAPAALVDVEQAEPESFAPESFVPESFEVESAAVQPESIELTEDAALAVAEQPALSPEPNIPPPPPAPPAIDFVQLDEDWTQPELLVDAFAPPAPPAYEIPALPVPLDAMAVPVPVQEQSPSELPPLTLAPGPLLFQGDPAPLAVVAHEVVEEPEPAELPALVPADFNDLIPSDILHGDLARPTGEGVLELVHEPTQGEVEVEPEPVLEAVHEAPYEVQPEAAYEVQPEAPYEVQPESAYETQPEAPYEVHPEVPLAEAPLDIEVPADASGLEALAPIPAAREVNEEPVAARRDGPRGLGYFGG